MMEFYSEERHVSRKERKCACCGGKIMPGDVYWRESGVWECDFFSRTLHDVCHGMEATYCDDIDNEFSWDSVRDHAFELLCHDCEHSGCRDDEDGWTECPYQDEIDCPKMIERFGSIGKGE